MKTNKDWFALPLMCMAFAAQADTVIDTQITKVYVQSQSDGNSNAHLIQIAATTSSTCSWNRLYIDFADKDLLASALANYLAGNAVSVLYTTTATARTAGGHVTTTCRVTSIF